VNLVAPPHLRDLIAALPPLAAGTELILRADGDTPTATLRRDGEVPRVFQRTNGRVDEIRPHDDDGLIGRALLADPAALQDALRDHTGPIASADVVAWRPRRRAVVRIAGNDGRVHWLKLLDAKSHRRAQRAFAALGRPVAPITPMTPAAALPAHGAFLAANAPGRSLRSILAIGGPLPLTTVAHGLIALGYCDVGDDVPFVDFAKTRTAAIDLLQKATAVRADLHELANGLAELAAVPAPRLVGFVHGDLHDKQIFVDGERTFLIDLEGLGIGDSRFDIANLAEHVRLRELQQNGTDSGLADDVAARCGLSPTDPEALAFRVVVRARLCGVYALRPRWHALVDRLVAETSLVLEQLR